MQKFKVSELIPHAQNEFFFDDMEGQKWKEFLESVRTSGVIEPPVVANEGVIVSGHQRIRACKELGIDEIFCEVRIYDDPDKMTKDLIETNVRQRGTINGSELKMGRIIKELERIYGVQNGNNQHGRVPQVAEGKSQSELAKELGMSVDKMNRLKKLAELPDEYQDMIESGTISVNTAATLISKLSDEEQNLLLKELPSAQKFTQAQMQQYIDRIKGLEQEKQELQEEAVEAVKLAQGAAKASKDSDEYLRIAKEKEKVEEERRKYYEKWKEEKNKDKGLSADEVQKKIAEAAAEATAKTTKEFRKLVDAKEQTIAELRDKEPETIEVEVIPDDYEEIKAELALIKQQLEGVHQTDFSRQFKRRAVEERSAAELIAGFENRLINETGAFLSVARAFEVEFDYCSQISTVSKSLVRKNIEQLQQILIKMDAAIMKGESGCKSA